MRRLLPGTGDVDDAGLVEAYRLPAGRSLRVNFVVSLDGAVTVGGRSEALGSPADRRVFELLRALSDGVLVGHGTAAAEGYRPIIADSRVGRLRSSLGRPATAPVVVVSRRASLDPGSRLVGGAVSPTLLVTCAAADADRRSALADAGVQVLVCGDDDVDLPLALDRLAERGLEQVLCEGGPQLLRAALRAGVVDELALTVSPTLVGAAGTRLLGEELADRIPLELRQVLQEDGFLLTRYGVRAAR
ncbi:dihydrofolate reductase family protein [Blastococcus haudaquaticus]|uniref:Riboflavin-specific deaminase C-terminal domain-containing protein n=1 Tax=Blastococcus haudaquaticus TaxID=1938745 RepID=A0A286GTV2_9ACTN|nr:dihydrofolate reductase family protein [Blastococcus haudaquaticus]SOD98958.1 riboflavin-specific deaminase C-terminal domain-containing protein [Blastococcus haudaquaticus]